MVIGHHNLSFYLPIYVCQLVQLPPIIVLSMNLRVVCVLLRAEYRRKSDNFQTFDYIFLRYHTTIQPAEAYTCTKRGHQGGLPCCGTVEDPLLWLLWFAAA